ESLACIDFDRGPVELSQPMPVPDGSSSAERLVTCDYFTINRHRLTSPLDLPDEQRGRILMVLIGDTEVSAAGEALLVRRGETVLLPATAGSVRVVPHTTATILEVFW
ncbi:MAG: hypothetical protein JSS02_29045, partial [Planctomycetes bacterium]|nr:hypothetical protein [Planctomycetota bacterium]